MKLTCPMRHQCEHIPPARVVARIGSAMVRVGSARLLRYQHVGIGNANVSCWGVMPNVWGIAFWWHIGSMILFDKVHALLETRDLIS